MRPVLRPAPRPGALLRALALATALSTTAGAGAAMAAAGDLVVVAPPTPVLPDDSATPLEAAISGNGRYVAITESREKTSLAPAWDYLNTVYPEQHIWRYDLQTGARVKVDKGGNPLGGAWQPVLSADGSVAAWTDVGFYPDSDYASVFRSRPDTGAKGTNTFPALGSGDIPEFVRYPSLTDDGTTLAINGSYYAGFCGSPALLWSAPLSGTDAPVAKRLTSCEQEETPSPGPFTGQVPDAGYSNVISGDGTTMVFFGRKRAYRHDVVSGVTTVLPLTFPEDTVPGTPSLSADGKTLAYTTFDHLDSRGYGVGLALSTTDLATGASTRIATIPSGQPRSQAQISGNGRYIAFTWPQSVPGTPTTSERAVYLFDRTTSTFRRVSQTAGGALVPLVSNGYDRAPGLSSDGRYVTFIAADAKQAVPDPATPSGAHVIRADVLGPTTDASAPPKPSLGVTQGYAGATLAWTPVTDPSGPVVYRIRQRPVDGATHSLVGLKSTTSTSLVLRGLVAGQRYRFAVQAEDAQGNRSTASTITLTAAGTPDPTPPTIIAPTKPYVGTAEQQLGGPFTIDGSDLGNVHGVYVGSKLATGLTVTADKITGTAPRAADAASVPVTVIGPFGATKAGRFYYRQAGTTETGD